MTTKITADNIEQATLDELGSGPIIANVQIANSSYTILDDTAVSLDGGYIVINGSKFESNVNILINGTPATSVTYVSETQVRAQVPAKTAGSYVIYLVNTDTGATAIRINGLTYSGVPSWVTGSTLSEAGIDEAISIQLSASDATSYQLQTGSTLPTGLSLAANGLLSGTVTGLNEDTLYNFTIEAIDDENQDSPRAFSITITTGDRDINSVVLALSADSNTFITDSSANSFTITPAGDTRPSAFSPYNTNWSNYFDGTGDYLSLAAADSLSFGTDDFTVEGWFNASTVSGQPCLLGIGGDNNGLVITFYGSAIYAYFVNAGGVFGSGNAITPNRWYHFAWTRNLGVNKFFLNGTQDGNNYTNSGNHVSTGGVGIGDQVAGTNFASFTGYLSNIRIVKGTALYTSNFTPPTSPLTAISGTSLLTCQSNRLIDNSTNNFTITKNGDVKVTGFGPFTETDTATGSGYFDGTGDYLSVPDDVSLDGFTGDFTVEFWVNFSSIAGAVLSKGWNGSTFTPYLFLISSGNLVLFASSGGSWDIANSLPLISTVKTNTWYHVAISRSGSNLYRFVNGSLIGTTTTSATFMNSPDTLTVGSSVGGYSPMNGYVSNVRVVKGTAVYTEAFTPPTQPLTAIDNTSLLTLQNRISHNNSQPIDESGIKNVITRNGNASVGSYTPLSPAGWSGYFDGSGDYLSIPDNAELDFGTADFTVEFFVNFGSVAADRGFLGSAGTGGYDFVWRTTTGLNIGRINTAFDHTFAWTPSAGVWYHIAYCRSGTNLRVFVDGTQIGSTVTNSISYNCVSTCIIGGSTTVDRYMSGHLSNLRLTKGTALYTSNFTPSTAPLEPVAGTSLLTLRSNSFVDEGPNRFAITRNGDIRIAPFSPFKTHTIVPDTHSVYFDGTDDYFTIPDNANLQLGTEDFTAEGWFYPTKAGTIVCFYTKGVNTTGGIIFGVSTTQIFLRRNGSTDSVATVSLSGWNHIAWVRNSGTMSVYLNGVSQTITNPTSAFNQTDTGVVTIGSPNTIASASNRFGGYASNFRIIKGTALYTSDFTPSTTPLTNVSNTQLLVCQSSTIIDNSDNQWPITVVGGAQPIKQNPFGDTITTGVEYSLTNHGGSYYFDGTGDYLTSTTIPALVGDFTIEGWIYPMWTPTDAYKVVFSTDSTITGLIWGIYGSGAVPYITVASGGGGLGTMNLAAPNNVIRMYQWQHIAMVRSNGVIRQYHNGVPLGSASTSATFTPTTFSFGSAGAGYYFQGYMSNFTINVGTALYTSAFVPPTAPPTPVKGTTLLLNGTNAAITDGVGKNVLEAVGTARITNGEKKYGTGSILINSTSNAFKTDGVLLPGDFTIEGWFKGLNAGNENFFIHQGVNVTNGFLIGLTTATIRWRSNGTTDAAYAIPGGNSDWYHFAIVRNGSSSNNVKVYYNGTQVTQGTYTNQILPSVGSLFIGVGGAIAANFGSNGYLDDFRITAGVARYTSNFTPPTSFKLK